MLPAMGSVLFLLGHKYPKVRKVAAEKLYILLQTEDDLFPLSEDKGGLDQVLAILSETVW